MKIVRCEFKGHFIMHIEDDATPDDIEAALELHISELESYMDPIAALDEYDWNEIIEY